MQREQRCTPLVDDGADESRDIASSVASSIIIHQHQHHDHHHHHHLHHYHDDISLRTCGHRRWEAPALSRWAHLARYGLRVLFPPEADAAGFR